MPCPSWNYRENDTPENIEQWIARGGHGILHTGDHESTVRALRQLQELYRAEEAT